MLEMLATKRRAVVVGVDSYSHRIASLYTAVADAQAIASLLQETGNFNIQLLLNEQATKAQLVEALQWLFPSVSTAPAQEIPEVSLFYFSGYGAGLTGFTGSESEVYQGDLVTHDFDPESPNNTGLALNVLSRFVSSSPVQQQVIWLDSDYSGRLIELVKHDLLKKDYCFIAASGASEPAYEDAKHGVFTNALLQSLDPIQQPDGQVTSHTLEKWFQVRSSELKSNQYSSLQHPSVLISDSPILLTQSRKKIPLSTLDSYLEDASVRNVVDRMASLAASSVHSVNISTSFLLFSIVDQGETFTESGSAKFLKQFLDQLPKASYKKVRDEYWERKGVLVGTSSSSSATRPDVQYITANVATCFQRAKQKAEETGDKQIRIRHLLTTLLEDWSKNNPIGAQRRLREMGVELQRLRNEYFQFLKPHLGRFESVWLKWLAIDLLPNVRHLSGYSPDVTEDKDLIGIEQDVKAFATLIAAQSVIPPLSIGIFGEWGSGKTFFMRQLRKAIADLAIAAQSSEQPQRELPFYKRIVQIEFNAWQYVEGNLWASLVEHIFENLQVEGETTVSEELQKHLIDKLRLQEKVQAQAYTDLLKAQAVADEKGKELSDAKKELDKKEQQLRNEALRQDINDFLLPNVQESLNSLLSNLGLQSVGESAKELKNGLNQAQDVLGQGTSVLTPLFYAKDRSRRWQILLLSLVAAPLMGWLLGMVPALLGAETIAQITALAGGTATLLTTGTRWVRKQSDWLSSHVHNLRTVQQQYEQQLDLELANQKRKIAQLELQFSKKQAEVQDAQQRKNDADRQVVEMQAIVDKANPANLLADFIQDRVASNDYRKHLGLLALIHDDFRQLSELMEEENWRLAPNHPNDAQVRWKSKKYNNLEEERTNRFTRINRIVLYIDDLDRCPPNKVVDVLQAIHLLLAFPLFVVVVGVDARWITRSLETRYRRLLNGSTRASQGPTEPQDITNLIGKATPHDYLEKIFQIPFWLQPMDELACRQMVKGLLSGQVKSGEERIPPKDQTVPATDVPTLKAEFPPEPSAKPSDTDQQLVYSPSKEQVMSSLPEGQRVQPIWVTEHNPLASVKAENLLIDPVELGFIENELAPLLGRSPRALKRFINVYRLIKAQYEQKTSLSEGNRITDYQAVLFLLAMDTGTPDVAPAFFCLLLQAGDQDKSNEPDSPPIHNLNWLIQQLESNSSVTEHENDWERLSAWFKSANAHWMKEKDISPLFTWAKRVVRYSFHGSFDRN